MGVSVFVPPGQGDTLTVDVWYADYAKVDYAHDKDHKKRPGWRRVPYGPVRVRVPLDASVIGGKDGVPVPGSRGLVLRGELRTTAMEGLAAGTRVLSLFLVNERGALEQDRDLQFVFQVKMALSHPAGFVSRPNRRGEDALDEDPRVLALNFRDRVEWAVGHNISIEPVQVVDGRVTRIVTTALPCHEVPRVAQRDVAGVTTGMADLARLGRDALPAALMPLVEAYGDWIATQQATPLDRPALAQTRDDLVAKAERAKKRIQEGIELLGQDAQVHRAFSLMNQAMHVAAVQADSLREDPRYTDGCRAGGFFSSRPC